ncbi:MAG TPA: PucR family transcriptional regulator ligand-binding domain-containing protein [Motilibacteraceae bacterium]|nr:PucR family transcriptional regulator ligand-binding domain-containing protein [Motilibacteraceae bacterium]
MAEPANDRVAAARVLTRPRTALPAQAGPECAPSAHQERRAASGRISRGLTVAEVLHTDALRGAEVVAGVAGLHRRVERLNVMEVPDILPWVKPAELLLTTGYPLRRTPQGLAGLVAALDAAGLAAVAVKPGRYLDQLPADAVRVADELGFPLVRLPESVAFDDVLEQVLTDLLNRQAAVLARAEEAHRALVQIVLDGGGLKEVAAGLVGLLDGAVLVTTADGRVLADAGPVDALAAVYTSGCFEETGRFRTEREGTGLHTHDGMTGNHVVVPVVAGGVDHGRIVAHSPEGRLGPEDVPTLERAATVVALAVTKQLAVRAVESKYQGDFLRDVLSGRVDPAQALAHAGSLGWDLDRPLVVVVAELDPVDAGARHDPARRTGGARGTSAGAGGDRLAPRPALERFSAAWQGVVRPRDARAPVVGFTQEVVAVLGLPPRGDVERLVRELVREVAGDGGGGRRSFSTGVSRTVAGVQDLPAAYEQARTAVRVGRRLHGRSALTHFDGLGVLRLLSLVEDTAALDGFVAEVLGPLAARDDDDAADLRRTLEVLLETNLNVAETARRLHFHYNTLRYRIGKLERMLGPFTEDANLRLSLLVALQALQLRP